MQALREISRREAATLTHFYRFRATRTTRKNPSPAVLASIGDQFGNKHLLSYNSDPTQPLYLTVADTSSYRRLYFYLDGQQWLYKRGW